MVRSSTTRGTSAAGLVRSARAQQALCRKQRGSANRHKAVRRVAVLHRRVRETRLDAHHKLALRLVRDNQAVHLERPVRNRSGADETGPVDP